jgi:hypothetical protein
MVALMFSFGAQALPGSPAPARLAASEVMLVRGSSCGLGFHRGPDGGCVPSSQRYVAPRAYGLPYVAPPTFGLPYVAPPAYGLPYVAPPAFGLPYVAPPAFGLPY